MFAEGSGGTHAARRPGQQPQDVRTRFLVLLGQAVTLGRTSSFGSDVTVCEARFRIARLAHVVIQRQALLNEAFSCAASLQSPSPVWQNKVSPEGPLAAGAEPVSSFVAVMVAGEGLHGSRMPTYLG